MAKLHKGDVIRIIIGLVLLSGIILSAIFFKTVKKYTIITLDEVDKFGWYGNAIMVGMFIVTSLFGIGVTLVLCLACGLLYGIARGIATSLLGCYLSTALSFFAGRFLFRKWMERKIRGKWRALDYMIEERALVTVILLRVAIFPPPIINYALSITKVSFPIYMLGTVIGLTPGACALTLAGTTIHSSLRNSEYPVWMKIVLYTSIGVTILISLLLTWWGRNALKKYDLEQKALLQNDEVQEDNNIQTVTPT